MQFEFNRQLPIALSTIPIIVIMSILRFTTIRSVSCSSFGAHAAAHAVIAIGSRQSAMVLRTDRQHVMPRVALVRPPPQHRPRQFLHMSTLALRYLAPVRPARSQSARSTPGRCRRPTRPSTRQSTSISRTSSRTVSASREFQLQIEFATISIVNCSRIVIVALYVTAGRLASLRVAVGRRTRMRESAVAQPASSRTCKKRANPRAL